jgi:ABC-type uncharacterized transport system auxiliary subunit
MIHYRKALRWAIAANLALAITGCGNILKSSSPAEQIYVLRAATATPPAKPAIDALVIVPRPVVQPGLATARIALTQPGNKLDYFAASRWGEPLPQVVSALASQTLRASGRFSLVAEADVLLGGASYELLLTVRHFEAEYADVAAAPSARVSFECLLTTNLPRRAVGRCDSEVVVPATENRMEPVVAALELAAQRALSEAIDKAADLAAAQPVKR